MKIDILYWFGHRFIHILCSVILKQSYKTSINHLKTNISKTLQFLQQYFQMTENNPHYNTLQRLDDKYQQNIRPIQSLIKTITLHNTEIYQLRQKYIELQKKHQQALQNDQSIDTEKSDQRKKQVKKQRNKFIEQALTAKKQEFSEKYKQKRMQRLQEIGLKYQQISFLKQQSSNYNIFFNIDEGLLQEVCDQLEQSDPNKKQIQSWLKMYNNSKSTH